MINGNGSFGGHLALGRPDLDCRYVLSHFHIPYVLLRRKAKAENWHTAIMHAYLPWLATVLVILGIFGIG